MFYSVKIIILFSFYEMKNLVEKEILNKTDIQYQLPLGGRNGLGLPIADFKSLLISRTD